MAQASEKLRWQLQAIANVNYIQIQNTLWMMFSKHFPTGLIKGQEMNPAT